MLLNPNQFVHISIMILIAIYYKFILLFLYLNSNNTIIMKFKYFLVLFSILQNVVIMVGIE